MVHRGAGQRLDVIDPATEDVIDSIEVSTDDDVDRTVREAVIASQDWRLATPGQRSDAIRLIADDLERERHAIASTESRNTGKPLQAAEEEVGAAIDAVRFFGGAARTLGGLAAGEYTPGRTSWTRREAIGVVAGIAPWNYPFYMATWKLFPALAVGNAVVLKASVRTPLTARILARVANRHLPSGVVSLVEGPGTSTGTGLVRHPGVQMVTVTGDTATGRAIAAVAATSVKRLHLELGGKAPAIVHRDVDVEAAANALAAAAFANAGQDCTAASRIIVHESVHRDFIECLVAYAQRLSVGGPGSGDHDLGPLISREQLDRVEGIVERARRGCIVATGGHRIGERGYFFAPTVLVDPDQGSEAVQEEIFGPVVTVQSFESEADAIRMANDVRYGLAASIWTADVRRALDATRLLRFGTVWINEHFLVVPEMPHGGFGDSGYGKDQSIYSLEEFTVVKHVMARLA